ncbi:MAG: universal stress protein [Hyphomonadaceae bacterium]|nr:universal stress protein [Hyphomonadaceae bacterium]
MGYRSILVQVDLGRGAEARVAAAARIAADQNAILTGVYLRSDVMPHLMAADGVVPPVIANDASAEEGRAKMAAANAEARGLFDAAVNAAGIQSHWYVIGGDTGVALVTYARRHDLVILPRRMKAAFGDNTISAEQIGMKCGGPVLVLPESGYPAKFGRKILVAWKDSRESARVLRDALPFLKAAEEIHFVTAVQDGQRDLDDLLQRQLEIHGCPTATLRIDRDTDIPTGDVIRRHVDMIGADMVVIGLFGRPRLAELVLGGVSRNMLDHLKMPLLVSH